MQKTVIMMIFITLCGCGIVQKDLEISQIKGLWEVDYELTMEEGKKSPKYDAEDTTLPKMLKKMIATMRVSITDTDMVYRMRGKELSFPYTIKSSDKTSVAITVTQGTNETTIIFRLRDKNHLNFKSSSSDDMDYYIWKRSSVKHET